MPKGDLVSISVIRRLPRYYRYLSNLEKTGATRISSRELAELMGLTASQIRQDLNCFGGFGQQGYGYNVSELKKEISQILCLDIRTKSILIGTGNLGKTVANQLDFESMGFSLIGVFDANPNYFGEILRGLTIKSIAEIEDFCIKNKPETAILCIPTDAVNSLASRLVNYGIKGFWNFSQCDLDVKKEGIVVENVCLSDSLMTLGYRINELKSKNLSE